MIYEKYKPLRNMLRKHGLYEALYEVWLNISCIGIKTPRIQSKLFGDLSNTLYDWELEHLAREIILHCQGGILTRQSGQMAQHKNLIIGINFIRQINEAISKATVASGGEALRKIYPLLHQQMPWQDDDDIYYRSCRYAKILQFEQLKSDVEARLGISIKDWYCIGLAISGGLKDDPHVKASNFDNLSLVAPGAGKAFFKLVAADLCWMRTAILKEQDYGERWAFTFNPLRSKPLIYDATEPDKMLGICDRHLVWRITDGVFYDILKMKGFSKKWGDAFEHYIGDVLKTALPATTFTVLAAKRYFPTNRSEPHDGADWRISDASGHAFIECKAKRLTLEAKMDIEGNAMLEQITLMAEFVVQNYKNIQDARNGILPDWVPNGLPIFCVVVTLENWRLHHPLIEDQLDRLIRTEVEKNQLPDNLVDECPYQIFDALSFERHVQDVARHSIGATFTSKPEVFKGPYQPLFPGTLAELMPVLAPEHMPKNVAV